MFFHPCKAIIWTGIAWVLTAAAGMAGPYSPAGGEPGSTAIPASSASIVEWAAGDTLDRGLVEIDNPALGYAYYGGTGGTPSNNAPLGEPPQPQSTSYGVALGQGGTITLTFAQPITNGPGADFAVFGNGFTVSSSASWIKPAFVEVSSDGVDFFPFPSVSLTPTATQVGSFGELNPTNLYDLAGKDPAGYGTPFDLGELAGDSPLLNINDVTEVRIVDCVGDINPPYATYDSLGNIINAPWPAYSSAGSEGFVLAGVGAINAVPEPGTCSMAIAAAAIGAVWIGRRRGVARLAQDNCDDRVRLAHPACPDSESGCPASPAPRSSRAAFFPIHASSFPGLAIQPCSPSGQAGWGPGDVYHLGHLRRSSLPVRAIRHGTGGGVYCLSSIIQQLRGDFFR